MIIVLIIATYTFDASRGQKQRWMEPSNDLLPISADCVNIKPGRVLWSFGSSRYWHFFTGFLICGGFNNDKMHVRRVLNPSFHGRGSLEPAICCPSPGDSWWRLVIRSSLTSLLAWKQLEIVIQGGSKMIGNKNHWFMFIWSWCELWGSMIGLG